MMNKKQFNIYIYIYRVNSFLFYYKVKNRVPLEYFYFKLYFRMKNRLELEMPL